MSAEIIVRTKRKLFVIQNKEKGSNSKREIQSKGETFRYQSPGSRDPDRLHEGNRVANP